jgi:light-regulated signal transduction histidine kinase (bacteriophytochrome)
VINLIGVARDITERKRTEEDILRMNAELEGRVTQRTAELESTLKELEAFSYSVSHDLRTPLRHISAYSTMLQEKCASLLSETSQLHLNNISKSAKRMNDLINDLLEFSKMGRAELRQQRISMDSLVSEIVQEARDSSADRAIQWEIESLPDALADRAMLRQVWANLLFNAVKYTSRKDKALIKVGCRNSADQELEFYVQDNGAGFDMQYADRLFGVFQRLHRADEFEGTGIGLANVRRIVARHGGRTWAEGKVNEGATFYFTLPRAAT